ncbi:MAG: hypothetical protein HYX66_04105 [Ignavibacteria bacterium]|nr:hypothetical protein [Ignavibacteria bacterium]
MMKYLRATINEIGMMTKQEEKFKIIEAWKQSGIGMQKYAEQHGIPYGTMQYWYKRYRLEQQRPAKQASFVALALPPVVRDEEPTASGLVIVLPSGVHIEVH